MKKYVIQMRNHVPGMYGKEWDTPQEGYDTLAEALAAYDKLLFKCEYRIAEAYVQVRYKPVKLERKRKGEPK